MTPVVRTNLSKSFENMTTISYSQNREDVLLWRTLRSVNKGFYIDVGANDPIDDSVTKLFYDAGWSGINIEPLNECCERLQQLRKRDVNIQALAGREKGVCVLHEFSEDGRYSTIDKTIAERHQRTLGMRYTTRKLPVITLNSVCEKHAPQEIHFLKIDVEGHEAEVLQGFDLARHRPWILLIEATEPCSQVDSSALWEKIVLGHGYEFALFDGLSKFYVSKEKAELKASLLIPPNIFDNYVTAKEVTAQKAESLKWVAARLCHLLWAKVRSALSNLSSNRRRVEKL